MDKGYYSNLKFQFGIRDQGYTMVKTMVFIYALKKANIKYDYTIFDSVRDSLVYIKDMVEENLLFIDKYLDNTLASIIRDCICSFDPQSVTGTGMMNCINIIDKMSFDDIKEFIVYYANESNERGDFSTPSSLIDLMLRLLDSVNMHSIYDQGCNNGDTLVKASMMYPFAKLLSDEIKFDCVLLTKIRLYFAGATKFSIGENNVLHGNQREKAVVGMATIPFNVRCRSDISEYNKYNKYIGEIKQYQTLDWIFVDRLMQAITYRGIIVMPEGRLSNDIDSTQRKNLIDNNFVEGVIKMPLNLFAYTNINVSLLIVNKDKNDDKVRFLDATKMCNKGRRISTLNVEEIIDAYYDDSRVTAVSCEEISKCDYDLNVNKYLSVMDISLEGETTLMNVIEDLFRGAQIPAIKIDNYLATENDKKTYKLLSVGDIHDSTFDIDSLQEIRNDGSFDRYLIKNGDVLISCKSSKIKSAYVEMPDDELVVATGSLLVIRCDNEKINPVYLKTFFDSNNGLKLLESIQTGTTIISINARALMNMRISCIDRPKQDKIASDYLTKMDQLKVARVKVKKLEKEVSCIYDNTIGG